MKKVLRVVGVVVLATVLYFSATFTEVWWTATHDYAQPSTAIVVLGAAQYDGVPSPVFASRLNHSAELYDQGVAPLIVVTGGSAPGDTTTEANAAYRYLRERGVPDNDLLLEVSGVTTVESLTASSRFLQDRGITDVVLVSDGWHLARSSAIARSVGLTPHPSPVTESRYSTGAAFRQMAGETAGLGVSRLIGFQRFDRWARRLGL